MEWSGLLTILSIALTVAIFVILIVVLVRNPLENADSTDPTGQDLIRLNNKVNWLYALEIAAVSVMLLSLIVGFFMYRRIPAMC